MKYLLDTNILSEWTKPRPDKRVLAFIQSHNITAFYVSEVTIVEIEKGIASLADTARKAMLSAWAYEQVAEQFGARYLKIDRKVIATAIDLSKLANKKRITLPVADALIAATAVTNNLIVASRDIKDFKPLDVPLFNPFTGERFNGA